MNTAFLSEIENLSPVLSTSNHQYLDTICSFDNIYTHTHTHTHTYIYIYIYSVKWTNRIQILVDIYIYIYIYIKAWTAIYRLSIIWKSDLTDKIKRSFFQAAVVSILLYGCTTWTLTKRLEKKLDGNYTRMLRAILNKSWQQHPTRHQLYGHLPPITKTIQVRRTRHAEHCWRSRDELISDTLLWTPTYGRAKAGRPARTYIQQLCEDTECSPEDLPEAMNDREKWRERVRDIRASGTTWWYIYIYIYIYMCVCVCVCVCSLKAPNWTLLLVIIMNEPTRLLLGGFTISRTFFHFKVPWLQNIDCISADGIYSPQRVSWIWH